jgi:hypothetical protein
MGIEEQTSHITTPHRRMEMNAGAVARQPIANSDNTNQL